MQPSSLCGSSRWPPLASLCLFKNVDSLQENRLDKTLPIFITVFTCRITFPVVIGAFEMSTMALDMICQVFIMEVNLSINYFHLRFITFSLSPPLDSVGSGDLKRIFPFVHCKDCFCRMLPDWITLPPKLRKAKDQHNLEGL